MQECAQPAAGDLAEPDPGAHVVDRERLAVGSTRQKTQPRPDAVLPRRRLMVRIAGTGHKPGDDIGVVDGSGHGRRAAQRPEVEQAIVSSQTLEQSRVHIAGLRLGGTGRPGLTIEPQPCARRPAGQLTQINQGIRGLRDHADLERRARRPAVRVVDKDRQPSRANLAPGRTDDEAAIGADVTIIYELQ